MRAHFSALFEAGGEERTRLLSEIANTFFTDLNKILIEYILLQYCKLTDSAYIKDGINNLTTNYILSLDWSDDTKRIMVPANNVMLVFREHIKDARNKVIGHLDLRAHLQQKNLGAFPASDEIAFWNALQAFINAGYKEEIGERTNILELTILGGDAGDLISALIDAVDYKDLVRKEKGFIVRRINKRRYRNA